ncbi:MAG: peptidylprolyl isomerase [Halioglobus sp.]|nr:peptidylprolyl isomerase [Halioglobus sp.]
MNVWCKCALVTASWVVCALVFADDDVVLQAGEFAVTTQDFDRYLTAQGITGAKRDRALAKQGAVQAVFENIYVVRAFAAKGEKNPSIDQVDINWQVENFRERLLMAEQLELEVQAALRDTDWDALAKEYYTANKAGYTTDEQVSAAHILISLADRTHEEAQARANEVVLRLQAGEDFHALAQEYSDDKSNAGKGGELGFFTRNRMVKPFADAAFAMTEEGEVSAPVETQYGYHIIRFNERIAGRQRGFEEVKLDIISTQETSMAKEVRQSQIAAMQNGALDSGLEVNRPLLNGYVLRYSADAEANSNK